jgi:hypothetical protein
LEDRTSFRTTTKELWKSPELNTQRDCLVEVQPDGRCTPSTELENWPRHAPMPARMRILLEERGEGLLAFLDSCWVVPRRRHLFSGLKTLQLQVQVQVQVISGVHQTYTGYNYMQIKGDCYEAERNKAKFSKKLMRLLPDNLESIELCTSLEWLVELASTWQVQQQQLPPRQHPLP